jgi:3-hydroxybutyryl-CoA dehydrogenase
MIASVGVIGLGLLGRGIAACLLGYGKTVRAYTRSEATRQAAREHIGKAIQELVDRAGFPPSLVRQWPDRYVEITRLDDLPPCDFVIESIFEDMEAKGETYDQIERVLPPAVPIASNTSAIPISLLQAGRKHPQRFVGMHWAEPAHATRFIEVIRGRSTDDTTFQAAAELAFALGKEPSLVQKDVRGFITNRLMYAMLREACYLLEEGVADAETIDRSFRNDMGWWAAIAGPFRWMDMTGLPAYAAVMKDLLPELSNRTDVPPSMKKLMDEGAQGFKNGRGYFEYTPQEAAHWEKVWYEFTWDVRRLAEKYIPARAGAYTRPLDPPPST